MNGYDLLAFAWFGFSMFALGFAFCFIATIYVRLKKINEKYIIKFKERKGGVK